MLLLPIRRKEEKFCSHEWPANILWKKSSRHSYLRTQELERVVAALQRMAGFFFFFFIGQWQQQDPGEEAHLKPPWHRVTGPGDWREGTFGSHYRNKGTGCWRAEESGSEVPDSPTGAVVNLHISTQEGASELSLHSITCANNNILATGTQSSKPAF